MMLNIIKNLQTNIKLLNYLAEQIKDKDYQSSLEGLTENQKSCKEFSRLFNKYKRSITKSK